MKNVSTNRRGIRCLRGLFWASFAVAGVSCSSHSPDVLRVSDAFRPLPPGAVRLSGYLENDIQNSIEHWNKGVVPYEKMVEFFRTGRLQRQLDNRLRVTGAVRGVCFTAIPAIRN